MSWLSLNHGGLRTSSSWNKKGIVLRTNKKKVWLKSLDTFSVIHDHCMSFSKTPSEHCILHAQVSQPLNVAKGQLSFSVLKWTRISQISQGKSD